MRGLDDETPKSNAWNMERTTARLTTAVPHEEEAIGTAPFSPKANGNFERAVGFLQAASDSCLALRKALASPHIAIDPFGRILGISGELARMLGYPDERLIGRRLLNRVCGADRVPFQLALSRFRSARKPISLVLSLKSKQQTRHQVLMSTAVMNGSAVAVIVLHVTAETPQ